MTIIVKSTVPAGTNRNLSRLPRTKHTDADVRVVSNPEFLKEGTAVNDFLRPDRIVIGCESGENNVGRGRGRPQALRPDPPRAA